MADKKIKRLKKSMCSLPVKPGIYLFKDLNDHCIYIGKARSIKDRVKSYFSSPSDSRIHAIVNETHKIDFVVTDSEREAYFLENNFIRRYQPKFNLRLKDDKSYPYIKVTVQQNFPGIYLCRRTEPDQARYFGPFTPASAARKAILLINKQFGIRNCKEKIPGTRKRPCLEYDLNQCSAPCVGRINPSNYKRNVRHALLFLEGKTEQLKNRLQKKMTSASKKQDFEQAKQMRDLIRSIDQIELKPKIISIKKEDKDFFGYYRKKETSVIYVFLMRNGKVIESSSWSIPVQSTSDKKALYTELVRFYSQRTDLPDTIILPFEPVQKERLTKQLQNLKGKTIRLLVPQRDNDHKIVMLATRNAEMNLLKKTIRSNPLRELQKIFKLKSQPLLIDGIDVSNTGGKQSVGSVVVFKDQRPSKKDYRKYKIKTITGPDDVSSIQEIVSRRYKRHLKQGIPLPDLILIDGGKGQFNAAKKVLTELNLSKIPVLSIAKKRDLIFSDQTKQGIKLDPTSSALKLLQHIRDEAHRFAITYHRKLLRDKSFESYLDDIPGIGPQRKTALLETYGSIQNILKAPLSEISGLIGKKAARNLKSFIQKK
ncbi:MAG: excinuclease ABC subunit UvrC [Candidatus Aminicenantes bacterium]|nr:excinuclease ABC subunit UvrC [Candidatus Aminicenantes bacterium]